MRRLYTAQVLFGICAHWHILSRCNHVPSVLRVSEQSKPLIGQSLIIECMVMSGCGQGHEPAQEAVDQVSWADS